MPKLKGAERLTKRAALENAKTIGFRPSTIIDVGFALGTEGLFDVFEGARHLLIEPMAEAEPAMQRFCETHPGSSYIVGAASDHEDGIKLAARDGLTGSTIHIKESAPAEWRMVKTVKLDTVAKDLPGPFLIKLDVEGHELHVLRGAEETLKRTEMIVTEVSTWAEQRPQGRASLMDLFSFFDAHGFVFYEFVEPGYRPIDGALYMFDAIFVRGDSMLRKQRSHKSKEQAEASRKHKMERVAKSLPPGGS